MFFDHRAWLATRVGRSKRVLASLAAVPMMAGALTACDISDGQPDGAAAAISSTVSAVAAPNFGGWQSDSRIDPLTDEKSVVLALPATEGDVVLGVSCSAEGGAAIVTWNKFLGGEEIGDNEYKAVTYRIGSGQPQQDTWLVLKNRSTSQIIDAEGFIKAVQTSDRLVVQTSPYLELVETAVFDTTGLADVLFAHRPLCDLFIDAKTEHDDKSNSTPATAEYSTNDGRTSGSVEQ